MKKKADLVYRKSTERLVGYTDLGNVNDELRLFESRVQSEEYRQGFATHVIVYMVRGIFRNLVYSFGFFVSLGFMATQLLPWYMEKKFSCQMFLTSWNLKELFGKLSLVPEYKKYTYIC